MVRRKPSRGRKPKKTVLLVTNGRITEKRYLDELKRLANRDKSLHVDTRPVSGRDPIGVLHKLDSPQGDVSNFDEVWVVVDHDGVDRRDFLRRCESMSTKSTQVRGIVSVPCFEVWLIAHYKQVGRYPNQEAAQQDLALVTRRHKSKKELPDDFPWDRISEACSRCHIADEDQPRLNQQGNSPSTGMPHLIQSLGLIIPRSNDQGK
ncbi:RloB family protein [Brevibacterium sp. BDJS002]|uniref:RloB family protein n=1 Tax=Brevibacterium sp. BDJS002 TaxID=3020906 RepID=UPI003FA489F7